MPDILSQFGNRFPCSEFQHGLFYEFDVALRFELGGEHNSNSRPLARFIHAFERASEITDQLFERAQPVLLFSSCYGDAQPDSGRLKAYEIVGLPGSSFRYLGGTPQPAEEDIEAGVSQRHRHWDLAEISDRNQLREVLWLSLGSEFGVKPMILSDVYIVDFKRDIIIHPYDDRGMDVVSMDKANLSSLYEAKKSWLLEHDMPRMKAIFET
ncbi:MAG: DUF3885 domain-containing protein [Pseudomonadota bacterium]